jgi:hypothetical protein
MYFRVSLRDCEVLQGIHLYIFGKKCLLYPHCVENPLHFEEL